MVDDVEGIRGSQQGTALAVGCAALAPVQGGSRRSDEAAADPPWLSDSMRRIAALATAVAAQDSTVLLLGETGTGKDTLARWIHTHSARSARPFVPLNCAAISPELAESELFGHAAGAYTGASNCTKGLVASASGGTLLLNEVGELPERVQGKLLSFLDDHQYRPVGADALIVSDVRVIAATNRDLAKDVACGRFRRDLYYRLDVQKILLPPLRMRREDIPGLATKVLGEIAARIRCGPPPALSAEVLATLASHDWPGNIRELRNALERALLQAGDRPIDAGQLGLVDCAREAADRPGLDGEKEALERRRFEEALRTSATRGAAAGKLGISVHALDYRLRKLGMTPSWNPRAPL